MKTIIFGIALAFASSLSAQTLTPFVPVCLTPATQAAVVQAGAMLSVPVNFDFTDPLMRVADQNCTLQATTVAALANIQALNQQVAALQAQVTVLQAQVAALTPTPPVVTPPASCTSPCVSVQATSVSVIAGSPATFTVTETGFKQVSWQSFPPGGTWGSIAGQSPVTVSGTQTVTYTTPATTLAMSGTQYRLYMAPTATGSYTYSQPATLTVTAQ
jgi:hypothetical protein